jgi:beta-glucosidase
MGFPIARPRTRARGRVLAGAAIVPVIASLALTGPAGATGVGHPTDESPQQPELGTRSAALVTVDGFEFRDLDGSGDLTPYEDWRLSAADRASDLVARLDLAQKAGLLMHGSLTGQGTYDRAAFTPLLADRHITTFISRLGVDAVTLANEHNALQEAAEAQPLGIPLLISTDPRSGFTVTEGQTVSNGDFTPFPDAIGLGATGDPALTLAMADIIRQEYAAVGIREALSPQADLATEPRWTRINGTFGSVGVDVAPHVAAYVEGLQGGTEGLTGDSVATVVKHWVGYGAQENGYDSHYYYGRYATFPGDNFAEHVVPYEGAFAANTAGVMPTYSILKDLELDGSVIEQVGANHNEYLLQDLLRGDYGFEGVITSDWGIANDCPQECLDNRPPASFVGPWGAGMPWGVEDLTLPERYASAINAGVDVIGGSSNPEYIVEAVGLGLLEETRVDEAAHRVLEQKFQLGLFENPYVDPVVADELVGNDEFRAVGTATQERSLTLLDNEGDVLPLAPAEATNVFLYGVTDEAAIAAGYTPVTDLAEADLAIVRLTDPRGGDDLTGLEFAGDEDDFAVLASAYEAGVTTVAVPNLGRPLVLGNVLDNSDAVLADYGVSDEALLNVISGEASPAGTLPFELPSSTAEVEAQFEDVPNDTANPLFEYGFGLGYAADPSDGDGDGDGADGHGNGHGDGHGDGHKKWHGHHGDHGRGDR